MIRSQTQLESIRYTDNTMPYAHSVSAGWLLRRWGVIVVSVVSLLSVLSCGSLWDPWLRVGQRNVRFQRVPTGVEVTPLDAASLPLSNLAVAVSAAPLKS